MMKQLLIPMLGLSVLTVAGCGTLGSAQPSAQVQRYGTITGLKSEKTAYYKDLHAKPWPGVIKRLKECNFRNYSIYLKEIDGKLFLFSYFEYAGKDFKADCEKMAADPETRRWWQETDPCQIPFPAAAAKKKIWDGMDEVFHME